MADEARPHHVVAGGPGGLLGGPNCPPTTRLGDGTGDESTFFIRKQLGSVLLPWMSVAKIQTVHYMYEGIKEKGNDESANRVYW